MADDEDEGLEVRMATPSEATDELADVAGDDEDSNVAGALVPETPMEPRVPDPEHAAFVTAGAFLALFVFTSLVGVQGALAPVHWAALVGGTAAVAGGLYLFYSKVV